MTSETPPPPDFRASIKAVEVEELIDLAVHRPLAHLLVGLVYRTPVTPDQLTWLSMVVGIFAGIAAWSSFFTGVSHMALAGVLLVLSAVIDCSDGQLARLRKTASVYGRMLDGSVDAVVQFAVIPAALLHLWWRHGGATVGAPPSLAAQMPATGVAWFDGLSFNAWLFLGAVAVATGVVHTFVYDLFKNVYLFHTQPEKREGNEDPEDVEAQWAEAVARGPTPSERFRFGFYRGQIVRQRELSALLDPAIPTRYRAMPGYTSEGAARYRGLQAWLMRAWSFYGIGTHIFGIGVAMAFDLVEVYVIARLLMNVGLVALLPWQRRASRAFFAGESAEGSMEAGA